MCLDGSLNPIPIQDIPKSLTDYLLNLENLLQGGVLYKVKEVDSDYNIKNNDQYIVIDAVNNDVNIYLPSNNNMTQGNKTRKFLLEARGGYSTIAYYNNNADSVLLDVNYVYEFLYPADNWVIIKHEKV